MRKVIYEDPNGKIYHNFEDLPPGKYKVYRQNRNGQFVPILRERKGRYKYPICNNCNTSEHIVVEVDGKWHCTKCQQEVKND